MIDPGEVLSKISGKRILDVATDSGGNIYHLINDCLSDESQSHVIIHHWWASVLLALCEK